MMMLIMEASGMCNRFCLPINNNASSTAESKNFYFLIILTGGVFQNNQHLRQLIGQISNVIEIQHTRAGMTSPPLPA